MCKVAVIVPQSSPQSVNRSLARALSKLGTDRFGLCFVQINDLPLYKQDLEADLPNSVAQIKSETVADLFVRNAAA
jgi:chromate reductase, NAD(P)H dehydrogenase (quinone)